MIILFLDMIDDKDDRSLFIRIYEEYNRLMLSVAYGILHDSFLAEDALQEAMLRIAKNIKKVDGICPKTKNFAVVIVRNTALDIYRKRHQIEESSLDFEENDNNDIDYKSPEKIFFEAFDANEIKNALKKLDPMYSDPMSLRYYNGLRIRQIAAVLGIEPDTAKKRIQRGLVKLAQYLTE